MKERFLKSLMGTGFLLLMFLSGAWAYFFFLILKNGGIYCVEPNKIWLVCEFIITLLVAGLGLILFVLFVKKEKLK